MQNCDRLKFKHFIYYYAEEDGLSTKKSIMNEIMSFAKVDIYKVFVTHKDKEK